MGFISQQIWFLLLGNINLCLHADMKVLSVIRCWKNGVILSVDNQE